MTKTALEFKKIVENLNSCFQDVDKLRLFFLARTDSESNWTKERRWAVTIEYNIRRYPTIGLISYNRVRTYDHYLIEITSNHIIAHKL